MMRWLQIWKYRGSRPSKVENVAQYGPVDLMTLDPPPDLAHLAPVAPMAAERDEVGDLLHAAEEPAGDRGFAMALGDL